METEEKKINKYLSRRWIITLWSCLLITVIVVMGYICKDDQYAGLAMTLSAVPVAFTSLETINKWKQKNEKVSEENN